MSIFQWVKIYNNPKLLGGTYFMLAKNQHKVNFQCFLKNSNSNEVKIEVNLISGKNFIGVNSVNCSIPLSCIGALKALNSKR